MLNNDWDYVEELLKYISSFDEFEVVTFNDAVNRLNEKDEIQ